MRAKNLVKHRFKTAVHKTAHVLVGFRLSMPFWILKLALKSSFHGHPISRIALDTARRHLINRVEELSEERESLRMENERSLTDLRSCQMQLKEAELELLR